MFKKFLLTAVTLLTATGIAVASVEVNKTDQAGLDGIRGIGPSLSKAILAERDKGGGFKDWSDLENRVKGISDKNSVRFSKEGLLVNGKSKENVTPVSSDAGKNVRNSAAGGSKSGNKE